MINTNTEESIATLNFDILNLNNTFNNIKINDDGIIIDGINVINYQIINLNELNNEYIFPNKSIIIISDLIGDLSLIAFLAGVIGLISSSLAIIWQKKIAIIPLYLIDLEKQRTHLLQIFL